MDRMKPILDRIPPAWGKWLPGPGWDDLLLEVNERLAVLDPGYEINQAKEKFGSLRFYFTCSEELYQLDRNNIREAMYRIAGEAEEKSATVCEHCGEPGRARTDRSWIKTLCDECDKSAS